MDHRTLENFATQPLLSRRQARWQELLAQCDFEIQYVKGKDNTVADTLSRLPAEEEVVLSITADESLLAEIWAGYVVDTFTKKLMTLGNQCQTYSLDGLLYIANRLILPRTASLRECFFQLAHDSLGHFCADKSYATLRDSLLAQCA
jgi:hypothetical protein